VPNALCYVEGYLNPDGFDRDILLSCDTGLAMDTSIDTLNYIFYLNGQHHHMYDEQSILTVFSNAGFSHASLRSFDPTLDQEARRIGSIYGIARKLGV